MNKYSVYLESPSKRIFDLVVAFFGLLFAIPVFAVICLVLFFSQGPPIIFKQKRTGYKGKTFLIYKFRSMIMEAESRKKSLKKLNEVGGPVFKITDDPRFTGVGKILSKIGLDELPQLINVLKGEMSIVGPRPLPLNEADRLSQTDFKRHIAKPGITSEWVTNGSHDMSFQKWMKLDGEYLEKANFFLDLEIAIKTIFLILKFMLKLF